MFERIRAFFVALQIFWDGMPDWQRVQAQLALGFSIICFFVSFLFLSHSNYRTALALLIVGVILGGIAWLIMKARIRAWRQGIGWRCPRCAERVGYGDAGEAFKLRGKLGNVPDSFSAFVICSRRHQSPVDWHSAWCVMFERLHQFRAKAKGKAIEYEYKKEKEPNYQHLYQTEKEFARKAAALIDHAEPGPYLYETPEQLRAKLRKFAGRTWPKLDRALLYDLLAMLLAYIEIVGDHELLGIREAEATPAQSNRLPERIHIDDIDSFCRVRSVPPESVGHLHDGGYLRCSEEYIKASLEEILHEPLHKKDHGGEINDLYSSNIRIGESRYSAAFMLKGPGVKTKLLRVGHCGHHGDQLVRLFDSPAEIYIVQFVGNIDEYIIKDVAQKVVAKRSRGEAASFCILNGLDTARILHAYGKV